MKRVLLVAGLMISMNSIASEETFNWLKSTSGDNSALSGVCSYVGNSRNMECNIRQISISKKMSKSKAEAQRSKLIAEIDKGISELGLEKYISDSLGDICKKITKAKSALIDSNQGMYSIIIDMCKKPSRDALISLYSLMHEIDMKTCNVFDYDTGTFLFEPVNKDKWVSNNGPGGSCGVVVVMTLEREKDISSLWTYTQNKQYTNTTNATCKSLAEAAEPMSYSWNGGSLVEISCEYINFGMF